MMRSILNKENMEDFRRYLILEEKSDATLEKYMRDVETFRRFLRGRELSKETVMSYKKQLTERGYAVRSINSMLASVNSLLRFLGREDCRVKSIRLQPSPFCPEEKELTKAEYFRLLDAAKSNPRLYLILQTICGTGIRVSELAYFTAESVKRGKITVACKGKTRVVFIPSKLRGQLSVFSRKQHIRSGPVFRTRKGNPLHRSVIWHAMKALCKKAGVNPAKVFPHNLRKLFARTFYDRERDLAKLADILGHSNINTTRIYIMTTGAEHQRKIDRLGLVV
ncbi:MAG: tyrosine-type recombinase/integrase [Clostridia bacterium]